MVDILQSSVGESLKLGNRWLDSVTDALRNCQVIHVFCSLYSFNRPWINFECGAGWARDMEVVPICHTGVRPIDLPIPMSLLQGLEAEDASSWEGVVKMIAGKLGSNPPDVD